MSRNVTFSAAGLRLEGVLHLPGVAATGPAVRPCPAAVVCHPHPLYGGDMGNSVVVAVCQALSAEGLAALRFNFRGVGGSGGSYGGGVDEREDVRGALDFLASQPEVDSGRLCLAGYSFGALVALSAVDERVRAVAAISPPLSPAAAPAPSLSYPALFVFGERDRVAPVAGLRASGIGLGEESSVAVISGADHFWGGQVEAAAAAVVEFFRRHTGLAE